MNKKSWEKREKKFKFIDLFAGIGGFRIPFEELNGENVFSSEIDKFASKTYEVNFKNKISGDIKLISEKTIPPFDILLAGFPCQPFSNAGLKKGFKDERGMLFFEIKRIIKYHLPKVILLENVKGLKNHKNGTTLIKMKKILNEVGYKVYDKILNAKNFGVPQNRERIYIVGFLKEKKIFNFPKSQKIQTKLGDILEKNVENKYTISNKLWEGHKRRKTKHKAKGNGFGYSLFDKNSPYTSTISARYYKDGSEILIKQKNQNPRKLTPREAARLQGFPEDFDIPVSDNQAYKQFGNAVAIPVIRALAKNILNSI